VNTKQPCEPTRFDSSKRAGKVPGALSAGIARNRRTNIQHSTPSIEMQEFLYFDVGCCHGGFDDDPHLHHDEPIEFGDQRS
jgi:hypothetical protein